LHVSCSAGTMIVSPEVMSYVALYLRGGAMGAE